jgi:branched-chain amino acid transport system substrate-binding protein
VRFDEFDADPALARRVHQYRARKAQLPSSANERGNRFRPVITYQEEIVRKMSLVVVGVSVLLAASACSSSSKSSSTSTPSSAAASSTTAPATAASSAAPASTAASAAATSPAAASSPAAAGPASGSAPATGTPLVFGASIPLSGVVATSGRQLQSALNASSAYINAHGGIAGHPLQWKYEDDGYPSSTQAAVAARALVADNVLGVLNFGTSGVAATYKYLNDSNVPDFILFSGVSAFKPLSKYATSVFSDYTTQGEALGQYIAKQYPGQSVAVLYQNNDLGQSYLAGFKKYVPTIATAQPYDPSAVDFSSQLDAMKASGAKLGACFCLSPQIAQMLKFNQSSGWNVPVITESSNAGANLVTAVGAALTEGVISMDFFPPSTGANSTPAMASLVKEIQSSSTSVPVTSFTELAGALNNVLVGALSKQSGTITRDTVATAVRNTQLTGAWYGTSSSLPTSAAPSLFSCWQTTVIHSGVPVPSGSTECENNLS